MLRPKTALYAFVVVTSLAVAACQPTEPPAPRADSIGIDFMTQPASDEAPSRPLDDMERAPARAPLQT